MGYKPVGVDDTSSLFPTRVMNALKSLFPLKADAEPSGLSTSTKSTLNATYPLKTSLANVATSGSYTDLTNKPTIPTQLVEDPNDPGTYKLQ